MTEKRKVILAISIIVAFLIFVSWGNLIPFLFGILKGIFIFSIAVIVTAAICYLILKVVDKIPYNCDEE